MTKLQIAGVAAALGIGILSQIPGHDHTAMDGHDHGALPAEDQQLSIAATSTDSRYSEVFLDVTGMT